MKGAIILTLSSLILTASGCTFGNTTPVAPTPTTPTAQVQPIVSTNAFIEKTKTALTKLGEASTEKDIADDIAKLQNKDSVASGTRIKFTGGSASVNIMMLALKDPTKLEDVKKEVKVQYDELMKISSTYRVVWLDGDASTIALVYYKVGDEAIANKVLGAVGGKTVAVTEPKKDETVAVAPSTKAVFAVGETVLADWKGGAMWWEAKVTKVEGNKISVKYTSDSTNDTLDIKAVAHKPTGTAKVSVGDKVVARWNGGSYYGATIKSISGSTATVDWDDKTSGTAPLSDIGFPGM